LDSPRRARADASHHPKNAAGTQQMHATQSISPVHAALQYHAYFPKDLQRFRGWLILWARHDSGTKGGLLLSRHKNNRNSCRELTAMSFQRTALSPRRCPSHSTNQIRPAAWLRRAERLYTSSGRSTRN
jgi:hypothetical protein